MNEKSFFVPDIQVECNSKTVKKDPKTIESCLKLKASGALDLASLKQAFGVLFIGLMTSLSIFVFESILKFKTMCDKLC